MSTVTDPRYIKAMNALKVSERHARLDAAKQDKSLLTGHVTAERSESFAEGLAQARRIMGRAFGDEFCEDMVGDLPLFGGQPDAGEMSG